MHPRDLNQESKRLPFGHVSYSSGYKGVQL